MMARVRQIRDWSNTGLEQGETVAVVVTAVAAIEPAISRRGGYRPTDKERCQRFFVVTQTFVPAHRTGRMVAFGCAPRVLCDDGGC